MSKAAAFLHPSLCWVIPAVEDRGTSGLLVARISMSMSSGDRPASSIACWLAITARSLVQTSGSAILLSLIPVFVVIHSSLVSTRPVQSSFVITLEGTWDPRPTIPAGGIMPDRLLGTFTLAALVVLHAHVHGLREESQAPLPAFPPDSTVLHPSERYSEVPVQPGVYPYHPGLN